jgi:hypothetical protein
MAVLLGEAQLFAAALPEVEALERSAGRRPPAEQRAAQPQPAKVTAAQNPARGQMAWRDSWRVLELAMRLFRTNIPMRACDV